MLKKLLASALMVTILATGPVISADAAIFTAPAAGPAPIRDLDTGCMLAANCYFDPGGDSDPGHWVCPDPATYMLCIGPG
jgi:hypothetical protein